MQQLSEKPALGTGDMCRSRAGGAAIQKNSRLAILPPSTRRHTSTSGSACGSKNKYQVLGFWLGYCKSNDVWTRSATVFFVWS
jgi:hypothetical protein